MGGKHEEAERLLAGGFYLCRLHHLSKRPVGDGWQLNPVTEIDEDASGYGVPLALNNLCSIDPDNVEPARAGLARCGFDLDEIMDAGVRTSSTRPGSGGRSTFRAPPELRRVVFASRDKTIGTILELRAGNSNLQDVLPGTTYVGKDGGGPYTQRYANGKRLDDAPDMPPAFAKWWMRMCTDVEFKRSQQQLLVGDDATLSVSGGVDGGGAHLAFASPFRLSYNAAHDVAEILLSHGYTEDASVPGRYAPPTATGTPCVRQIPGRDALWQSDHASDPLNGTFDAWTAHVVLDHNGQLAAAEDVERAGRAVEVCDEFEDLPAVRQPGAGAVDDGTGIDPALWPAFSRNAKTGRIEKTLTNTIAAVREPAFTGWKVGYDAFRDEIMLTPRGTVGWRAFGDADYVWLRAEMMERGFEDVGREMVRDVVHAVAHENRFDSAQLWLNGLKWDGVPRVEGFLSAYMAVDESAYTRAVSVYLWTAMAGRVLTPGVKADMVPILVGDQGLNKSTAIAAMAPAQDFFCEISFDERDDDLARKMRGCLLAEIAELRGIGSAKIEGIRAFVTRQFEKWVPKFKEFSATYPRRLMFIGTSNEVEFLADACGNRRWLPVDVTRHCDVRAVARDRDQLWAEAATLYCLEGVAWSEAQTLAPEAHDRHRSADIWEDRVETWLETPDEFNGGAKPIDGVVRVSDALSALGVPLAQQTRFEQGRVGNILRALGLVRKKVKICGKARWAYEKPNPAK